jgi:FkbH-like protein
MVKLTELLSNCSTDNLAILTSTLNQIDKSDFTFAQEVNISFLRNFTIEGIEPFLKYHLYLTGIKPKISFGGYGSANQEILDSTSHLYEIKPEIIVLSWLPNRLDYFYQLEGWQIEQLFETLELLRSNFRCPIIINTLMAPFYPSLGASNLHRDISSHVNEINQGINDFVHSQSSQFLQVDWNRILRILGREESIDYRYWYMFKSPFKQKFLSLYAGEIAKVIRALKGIAKKCVVLDCDNTLWGGIIGEDGLQGIALNPHNYPGNIFYDFQNTILHLLNRGVLIALCSKNNPADVWEVLDNHPHCCIKQNHLAGWRLNWLDKVTNLIDLAKELNLGLDSFVFVDDNPVECEQVKQMLPEVTVLKVPDQIYRYPSLLLESGLFDTFSSSNEDSLRTEMYQTEAKRVLESKQFETLEQYLASLNLVINIHSIQSAEIPRVAQLTQKTNQFNLTTRRYSETDITTFFQKPDFAIYTLTAKDRFGDYGLTGVIIARREDNCGIVDTFLLSCRVLGRQIELEFANHCLRQLTNQWNLKLLKAEYVPTSKNGQVADFWVRVGFLEVETLGDRKVFQLQPGEQHFQSRIDFIQVVSE